MPRDSQAGSVRTRHPHVVRPCPAAVGDDNDDGGCDATTGTRARGGGPGGLRELRAALPRRRHRHAHVRAAGRPRHHPGRDPRRGGGCGPRRTTSAQPLPRALVQRVRRGRARGAARAHRAAARADGCALPHRGAARRPLPHDRLAQAHRRLWLPGAAHRDRPVRPCQPACGVAIDRQLLPRRRGRQPHHAGPRRGGAAGGHEPGTLRLAGRLGDGA